MANDRVEAADAIVDVKVPVLDNGFVMLDSYMGSDSAITRAARNCTSGENVAKNMSDRDLIRYLMRMRHTSPFEFVEMKFLCRMPIFVARQWVRHRTASINEMSGRFSELPELVYVPEPDQVGYQSKTNKQGRGEKLPAEMAEKFCDKIRDNAADAFSDYHLFLGKKQTALSVLTSPFNDEDLEDLQAGGGISRELARIDLPLNTYTQWAWKIDLHNLLHFLGLRLDPHAQWEIRQYAVEISKMVKALCPLTWEAFEDYRLGAVTLSRWEVEVARRLTADGIPESVEVGLSPAELKTLVGKLVRLGLLDQDTEKAATQFAGMTKDWLRPRREGTP